MAFTLATLRTAIRNYTEVGSTVLSDTILDTIIINAEARVFRTVDADATTIRSFLCRGYTNVCSPTTRS